MALKPVPPLQPAAAGVIPVKDPYYIVMVIDGIVYNVMTIEGTEAAKFLAQPTFVQVEDVTGINAGDTYDAATGTFSRAE